MKLIYKSNNWFLEIKNEVALKSLIHFFSMWKSFMNQQENHLQFNRKMGKDHKKVGHREIQVVFQQKEEAQSHLKLTID